MKIHDITPDNIPNGIKIIIEILENKGYEAYVFGKCVRDCLMGVVPKKFSICTNAPYNEVFSTFFTRRYQHGTHDYMTIMMKDGNYVIHMYQNKRNSLEDLKSFLSKEVFTINAIAYSPTRGLIDPHFGITDISHNQIRRCTSLNRSIFKKDPIWMLRAIRYASQYEFDIETFTSADISLEKEHLQNLLKADVKTEFCKFIIGKNMLHISLMHWDVLAQIIPELEPCVGFNQNNRYHQYTVYDHMMRATSKYTGDDLIVRLALFFHDIGKPSCYVEDATGNGHFYGHADKSRHIIYEIMDLMEFPTEMINQVTELISMHDCCSIPTVKHVKKMLNKLGEEQYRRLLVVQRCDILSQQEELPKEDNRIDQLNQCEHILNQLIADSWKVSIDYLVIDGRDIMSLGIPQGPLIGKTLKYLLQKVIAEEIPNEKFELLIEARKFIRKNR